ncbi:MAG: hypothetical protein IPG98_14395 [Burkholderiales bacterium]|nr:hypothetical protein [Burkholderiales bacterium]
MHSRNKRFALHSIAAAMALTLAACGGGGDDPAPGPGPGPGPGPDPVPPPPPVTETLSGQVARNGTLKNVVVCLDLNANDACDADEPAATPTGADGVYTLSYEPAKVGAAQAAAAPLIAPVLAGEVTAASTAIDSASPDVAATTASYVMKRAAGSAGAINPLTTLVQAGVADGMSEAVARENVALQLGIDATKIDNYQDDPPHSAQNVSDTARAAAAMTSHALRVGAPLKVVDQKSAATEGGVLASLWYRNADNYFVRTLDRLAQPAGDSPWTSVVDARSGKNAGVARSDTSDDQALYRTAYLGSDGWRVCDRNELLKTTRGNPSRSVYCDAQVSVGYTHSTSVAGQAMADLVTRWQGQSSNIINTDGTSTAGLVGKLGNTVFPDGAEEEVRSNLVLVPGITIDNIWTRGLSQTLTTTLQGLPTAFPVAGVDLAKGSGTLNLGNGTGNDKTMRVAFGAASSPTTGATQYYQCDLDPVTQRFTNPPKCEATIAGTYTIESIHGAPVMRFLGAPDTVMSFEMVYTEIDWGGPNRRYVYRAHETKPALIYRASNANRLNATAWAAMKAQLGL